MIENIASLCLLICFILQLLYYFVFYIRIGLFRCRSSIANSTAPISVIICAKNEENNLKENLSKILNQDYPIFEVLVVDDYSTDQTFDVLSHFQIEAREKLKVLTNINAGKKGAIEIGVANARHEWLVFTDADCFPYSNQWLKQLALTFNNQTEIVLGYGAYTKAKGLLNQMIRYDTLFIAMQYFSFALAGVPYMGVGRNLAYRKSLFVRHNGLSKHRDLMSGDDDLFVNQCATADNTAIALHRESFTYSLPKTSFFLWIRQKSRHITTSVRYKLIDKLLVSGELITRSGFYLSFFLLLSCNASLKEIFILYFVRFFIASIILSCVFKRFFERDLLYTWFLLDLIVPINYLIITFVTILKPSIRRTWN